MAGSFAFGPRQDISCATASWLMCTPHIADGKRKFLRLFLLFGLALIA